MAMDGMNAIHLACVYHPRAVIEIGDLIEAWLGENEKKIRLDVITCVLDNLKDMFDQFKKIIRRTK